MPNTDKNEQKVDITTTQTNLTDPYVDIRLDKESIWRTPIAMDTLNPTWNENYRFDICHIVKLVTFVVLDKDKLGSEKIGSVSFFALDLLDGQKRNDVDGYPIMKKAQTSKQGALFLSIQFVPAHTLDAFKISEVHKNATMLQGYFPTRTNCRVTLYQDAEVPSTMQRFKTMNPPHQPSGCWRDIYDAIMDAKHIICITAWSLWTELKLFRGKDKNKDQRTLGEILLDKANAGVNVYIELWDDPGTAAYKLNPLEHLGACMFVHDEESYKYFKGTGMYVE